MLSATALVEGANSSSPSSPTPSPSARTSSATSMSSLAATHRDRLHRVLEETRKASQAQLETKSRGQVLNTTDAERSLDASMKSDLLSDSLVTKLPDGEMSEVYPGCAETQAFTRDLLEKLTRKKMENGVPGGLVTDLRPHLGDDATEREKACELATREESRACECDVREVKADRIAMDETAGGIETMYHGLSVSRDEAHFTSSTPSTMFSTSTSSFNHNFGYPKFGNATISSQLEPCSGVVTNLPTSSTSSKCSTARLTTQANENHMFRNQSVSPGAQHDFHQALSNDFGLDICADPEAEHRMSKTVSLSSTPTFRGRL